MRTKTAKLISALAMAGVLAFTSTAVYAEEAVSTAAEQQTLETYIPTNDDEEFPFNMEINVMPGSIRYIELDEPIYGYERILDSEALIFDVEFSLKDEFKDFDGYEFQVYSSDYSEEIASEYLEKDEVLTLSGLSVGEGYKIGITLESESLTASYGGQFAIQDEWSGSLTVDLFYQLAHMDGDAVPFVVELTETEPRNNKIDGSDALLHSGIMNGSISSGDEDYFRYSSPNKVSDEDPEEDDRTGVANLEFTLDLDSAAEICMEFFDENDISVRKFETGKGVTVTHLFCRLANVPISAVYKINITSKSTKSIGYKLKSDYQFALAWYGQHISKDAEGVYWNTNKLGTLEYNNKAIFSEGKGSSWFDTACGVVASAMALRNMNATMNGYDFRTGYSGELAADPFTVMLASCDEDGKKMISDPTVFIDSSGTGPNHLESRFVAPKFNKSKKSENIYKNINTLTGSTATEDMLREKLKAHKYVVIYFNEDLISQHFMLLTDLKSGSGSFAERAIVCDPAAYSYNKGIGTTGKGLPLSETEWYNNNKSYVQLSTMIIYY